MSERKEKKKRLVFLGGPLPVEEIKKAFAARGNSRYRLKFIPRSEGFSPREAEGLGGLVVTDPLPGADCREFIKKFKFMNNTVPVIMLGVCEDETSCLEALRAGADDSLAMDKPDFAAGIAPALDKAAARQVYDDKRNWLEGIFFENHTRWLAFLDAITDFIFILDEQQRFIKANSALAGAYGRHPKDVTGMKSAELLGAELAAELEEMRRHRPEQPVEKKINDDYYLVSVFPLRYENQDLTIYFLKKITDMRRLKEHLFHSDKLASIGLLVSGVAHELNNPLTGIVAYTELLRMKAGAEGPDEVIGKIMVSADRCKKIVENLLTFSRQQTFARSFESINDVIDRTVELRSYWLRQSGIEVVRDFGAVPSLFVDAQQIQQVILNVLINAEQAIADAKPPEGKIIFRTTFDAQARKLSVSITDNGSGIPERIADKIFDPFFTTRSVGVGTGLGLSISHGIVTGHGGEIRVERAEEGGARFVIELPQKQAVEILREHAEKI
ncbi:MAG: ATP-binding protein [Nitrospiraceae bacterium]|nr:ATP-binding protein [Nitrospiraceae bacterium]